jgi:hypothetical protein
LMFAGLEATRATTNYSRQNSKELSRVTSNTARTFAQTAKETVHVQGEEQRVRGTNIAGGHSGSTFIAEGRGETSTTHLEAIGETGPMTASSAIEDTTTSDARAGTTTTAGMVNSPSDSVPGVTEKTKKKS